MARIVKWYDAVIEEKITLNLHVKNQTTSYNIFMRIAKGTLSKVELIMNFLSSHNLKSILVSMLHNNMARNMNFSKTLYGFLKTDCTVFQNIVLGSSPQSILLPRETTEISNIFGSEIVRKKVWLQVIQELAKKSRSLVEIVTSMYTYSFPCICMCLNAIYEALLARIRI